MPSGKSKFKILWKYQKKEEPKPFSRGEIWKKLYGEYNAPFRHEPDLPKKENVFNPRDKIFSESAAETTHQVKDHPMREKWRRLSYFFRRHIRIVLGFAPIFILAFLALFLLFHKSSDVSVLTDTAATNGRDIKDSPQRSDQPYTIQACLYEHEAQARQLAADLQARGFQAYVYEASTSKGSKQYRVYVGHFSSPEDARDTLSEVQKIFHDSFIRK